MLYARNRALSTLNTDDCADQNLVGLIDVVMGIQEFMAYASVASNCAILFFTYDDFGYFFGVSDTASKLWFVVILEHILMVFKQFVARTIPDSPGWVVNENSSRKSRETIASAAREIVLKRKKDALERKVKALRETSLKLSTELSHEKQKRRGTVLNQTNVEKDAGVDSQRQASSVQRPPPPPMRKDLPATGGLKAGTDARGLLERIRKRHGHLQRGIGIIQKLAARGSGGQKSKLYALGASGR